VIFKPVRKHVTGRDAELWTYDVLGTKQTTVPRDPKNPKVRPQARIGQLGQIAARSLVPADRPMAEHAEFLEQAIELEYWRAAGLLSEANLAMRKAGGASRYGKDVLDRAFERKLEERDFPERTTRHLKTADQLDETAQRSLKRAWVRVQTADEKFLEYIAAAVSHSMLVHALYPATLRLCGRDNPHPISESRLPLHDSCWKSLPPMLQTSGYTDRNSAYSKLLRRIMYNDQWEKPSAEKIIREFREALLLLSERSLRLHKRAVDPELQSMFEQTLYNQRLGGQSRKYEVKLFVRDPKISADNTDSHVA
jgi:hypothetical protein